MLDEVVWLQADFSLERRWKIASSFLIAREVINWHFGRSLRLCRRLRDLLGETVPSNNIQAYSADEPLPIYSSLVAAPDAGSEPPAPEPAETPRIVCINFQDTPSPRSSKKIASPSGSCLANLLCWRDLDDVLLPLVDEFNQNWDIISLLLAPRCSKGFFKSYAAYDNVNFAHSCQNYLLGSSSRAHSLRKRSPSDERSRTISRMERLYDIFCGISKILECRKQKSALDTDSGMHYPILNPSNCIKESPPEHQPENPPAQTLAGCVASPTPADDMRKLRSSLRISAEKMELDNIQICTPINAVGSQKFDVCLSHPPFFSLTSALDHPRPNHG